MFLTIIALAQTAGALTIPTRPPEGRFVADDADVLDPEQEESLNTFLAKVWREDQVPFYVVTVPSLAEQSAQLYTIKTYAFSIFNGWGIGSQDHNYGILLLLSKGDRQARIELGWEWGNHHNVESERIMNEVMVPNFKAEDYARGIRDGAVALSVMARAKSTPAPKAPWRLPRPNWPGTPDWDNGWTWVVLGAMALLTAMVVSQVRSGDQGWGHAGFVTLGAVVVGCFAVPISILGFMAKCQSCGMVGGHRFSCPWYGHGRRGCGGHNSWPFGSGSTEPSHGSHRSAPSGPAAGGSSGGGGATGSW